MLTESEFAAALQLADAITGELIANLDASIGAAAALCRASGAYAAQDDLDDAAGTLQLLLHRLEDLADEAP